MSESDALEPLGSEVYAALADRRGEPRYLSGRTALLRPRAARGAALRPAVVTNVSANGLGLFLPSSAEVGQSFELEFPGTGVRPRVGHVCHATPEGAGWLVGCELAPPLSEEELDTLRT